MNSLAARLVLAASVVLSGFVVATGLAMEKAFESSARQSVHDRLVGLVYTLLGATDIGLDGQLNVAADHTADERLLRRGSGLRAYILSSDGKILWRSVSASTSVRLSRFPAVGEWLFSSGSSTDRKPFVLTFGVQWSTDEGQGNQYTFLVAEDAQAYYRQLGHFRSTLLVWLVAGAALLLLAQLAVLKWGLRPIGGLIAALRSIEAGSEKETIEADCPGELRPLVDAMNALLFHERSRQARIRNSLDDLAHSLKTPLAVLRGVVDQSETGTKANLRLLGEQVGRIDQIVRYQLHRAAARGRQGFLRIEPVEPILRQLVGALAKVYKSKNIRFGVHLDDGLRLRADPGDLMEILGNLLDNACKWCRSSVNIRGRHIDRRVELHIDDDGPGFPEGLAESLIQRGARADAQVEGQGIGLAVVSEIVSGYGGLLELGRSDLGGARIKLDLPAG